MSRSFNDQSRFKVGEDYNEGPYLDVALRLEFLPQQPSLATNLFVELEHALKAFLAAGNTFRNRQISFIANEKGGYDHLPDLDSYEAFTAQYTRDTIRRYGVCRPLLVAEGHASMTLYASGDVSETDFKHAPYVARLDATSGDFDFTRALDGPTVWVLIFMVNLTPTDAAQA